MSFFTAISGPRSTCLFSGTFCMLSIFLCYFFFTQVIQLESWEEKKSGTEKENCILKICLNYLYSHYPVITMLQTHLLTSRTFPFFLLYLNSISQLIIRH